MLRNSDSRCFNNKKKKKKKKKNTKLKRGDMQMVFVKKSNISFLCHFLI